MANDNRGMHFLSGLVVGMALGAASALLFAPKSDRELRETLTEIQDRFSNVISKVRERGEKKKKDTEATPAEQGAPPS